MLCIKISQFLQFAPQVHQKCSPLGQRQGIYVSDCLLSVLQCRIPAQIRMEAACTRVGLTAAKLTATVKLVTSWQRTGKPVKVNSPVTIRVTLH